MLSSPASGTLGYQHYGMFCLPWAEVVLSRSYFGETAAEIGRVRAAGFRFAFGDSLMLPPSDLGVFFLGYRFLVVFQGTPTKHHNFRNTLKKETTFGE